MNKTMLGRINALRLMTVGDLRLEWMKLYGESTHSRNRDYLWKRLAWRVQELAHGGLSDDSNRHIDALAPDGFDRARTPAHAATGTATGTSRQQPRPHRDSRLPSSGTVISKTYRGRELRVVVREDGLELDGTMHPTATALAKAITGSRSINGNLFLGITKRRRS